MKFIIDTANVQEIKKAASWGILDGVTTNPTLVAKEGREFTEVLKEIAAKAGATFVSPFVGSLDDISTVEMDLVPQIRTIFDNYDFPTQILAPSIRNPVHVVEAMAGADVATMPFGVIEALQRHPLTDAGLKKFLEDWQKTPQPARKG
jgi:transaldolase